jgi:hypothetical protein
MKNNLLKIFLIFNLVSLVPANNSSVPLLETELQIGQNTSEVVKREGSITLMGGMKVTGITFSHHQECQRSCTLAFPVVNKLDNEKGFLTSASCVNAEVFLGETHIGVAVRPFKFDSEQGLDYAFVKIFDSFWSDKISSKMAYSHCASTGRGIVDIDEPLLIIPTPQQPLSVGDKVYAHGGISGMVHGKVLATDVTIKILVPGSCAKETDQLHKVVKVQMNKPYQSGDLGTPVYILLPVPGSKKNIASPVGQVVEIKD